MRILVEKKIYKDNDSYIDIHQKLVDNIEFSLFVEFQSEKFLEYQKDLLQEFVADFVDKIQNNEEAQDNDLIREKCEQALQELNTKLKTFADKVRDVEYFSIKWYMQIIIGGTLISSMIGTATVIILRDRKIYYTLTNSTKNLWKIDLFSEFIEWDIESGDEIIYLWTKLSDVFDAYDIKDMEQIIKTEENVISFIEEVLWSRVNYEDVGFLIGHTLQGMLPHPKNPSKFSLEKISSKLGIFQSWKELVLKNKYQVTVWALSLFVAFMLYSLVSQLMQKPQWEVYVNSQGVTVDLTIDDIKKDIVLFKSMDPTSDEKAIKYQEILNKVTILQSKGRRVEDLQELQKILKSDYYKWFNIITVTNLTQFDDPVLGKKTRIMTINSSEKSTLGELSRIEHAKDVMIAWSKAAILGVVNENSRGSLVSYNTEDSIWWCSLNLLRNGFFCYTSNGKIYAVTRAGIEPLTTSDPDGFPMSIGGIGVYGKSNIYVFSKNVTNLADSTLVTRYRNTLWSQAIYQQGQRYMIAPSLISWMNFWTQWFGSFVIDVNFLAWANGKLYQFRRNPATSFNLAYREIKLLGWDNKTMTYSNNVRIISPSSSRYVYLFDKDNQRFSVYESRPLKTNDQYATTYNLNYLFSFVFDLGANKVIDVTIPDELWNRPELYILTQEWVNKIQLYEFIDSIKNDNALKQIN